MKLHHVAELLRRGEHVTFKPSGHSMTPIVRHHEQVTLSPLADHLPETGNVVLVKVKGGWFLHLVSRIKTHGGKTSYQISNARGHVNGWVSLQAIAGWKAPQAPHLPRISGHVPLHPPDAS